MNKKGIILSALFCISFFMPSGINSQEEQLVNDCLTSLKSPFVAGDRSQKAFLTGEEIAEFRTTLFNGNTYRIVLCSHQEGLIEFSLYDTNRNLLYTSSEYGASGSWDFKMEGSMECIIEARLNNEIAESGMAMLLIGFKSSDSK
ncbi:hypothetical protein [Geofilum rubicundum]|uniref:Uncharacterized protein n=1 Tax=Geofilum rubicundum JCM 15548 TaxID=1236989 RepID=A0A0E9LTQ1_9BACT|nr:hypothetical protein [Geofilum rubicundum]GAO28639.1 hypothetical protein JCM15548_1759 [Geofilum rubicundum JCM 15548]